MKRFVSSVGGTKSGTEATVTEAIDRSGDSREIINNDTITTGLRDGN